jgi:REP element-mobilizing transposase RayT
MPNRKEQIEINTFYHIYNRGNNKENIFFEEDNYRYFLQILKKYLNENALLLHSYCLMPNHYHAIVETTDRAELSKPLQHCMISYVKAINKRYTRVGHLFQDRFKVKRIDSTEYLLHLSRYIHTNLLAAKIITIAERWQYSSYKNYISEIEEPGLTTQFILSHFKDRKDYQNFVELFLQVNHNEIHHELWSE